MLHPKRWPGFWRYAIGCVFAMALASVTMAVEDRAPPTDQADDGMSGAALEKLLKRVDKNLRVAGNVIEFEVEGHPLVLIYDEAADRMRLMSPVTKVVNLKEGELLRVMQANFESALDARYAIANEMLWSVYVHPLSPLTEEQFVVAIGQTINVVVTFGQSYSSGVFVFGGGDSAAQERRDLIDRLEDLVGT